MVSGLFRPRADAVAKYRLTFSGRLHDLGGPGRSPCQQRISLIAAGVILGLA
jgi:hypothetical protein